MGNEEGGVENEKYELKKRERKRIGIYGWSWGER